MPWKVLFLVVLVTSACSFDPGRDKELEAMASEMVEADQILAMHNFDQIVIQMSGADAFTMEAGQRKALAKRLARKALAMRDGTDIIMIGFARTEPDMKQISYSWEYKDGALIPIEEK